MAKVTYSLSASKAPNRNGATKPIRIPAGEDRTYNLTIVDGEGEALDVTGATILVNVRKNTSDGDIVITRQATLVLPYSAGTATLDIVAADTIDLAPASKYIYDVWLTDSDGDRARIIEPSPFTVEPAITDVDGDVTVPVSSSPFAQGLYTLNRVSDGVIAANTFVKSGTTAGRCAQFTTTDDPWSIIGIALDAAAGAGTTVRVVELAGFTTEIKIDGTTSIAVGDHLTASTTTSSATPLSGRATKISVPGIFSAIALEAAAATADLVIDVQYVGFRMR